MSRALVASMLTARAEECLRDISALLDEQRPIVGFGIYSDRVRVLINLRLIRERAREAEILLNATDVRQAGHHAGRRT